MTSTGIFSKRKFVLSALAFLSLWAESLLAQSAEPLKKVIPVSLNATTGIITVGGTVYAGANPGMHMVAFKRQPNPAHLDAPDLIGNQTFTNSDAASQFLQSTLSSTPDALLLVNGVGNYGFGLSAISQQLASYGAAKDINTIGSAIPFTFIGNGGLKAGSARQRGLITSNLTGSLAADSNGNYTLIQTDYVRYDIQLDGTIRVGSTTYSIASSYRAPGCDGSNAFHLVVVQRDAPDITVANNSCCTAQSDAASRTMVLDLGGVVGREDQLAFIASNGRPIPANWNFGTDGDARIYPLAQRMAALGGYWETMVYLTPTDTYSLVGTAAPPSWVMGANKRARESSSVYPGHPTGELHGVLARGPRANWYSPINADTSGMANLGFYDILAQVPVNFPHPVTAQELSAYQYISNSLCGGTNCSVRNQYPDTSISISAYLTVLEALKGPNSEDCGNSNNGGLPFCVVRQQLLTEFRYVANIRAFNANLQSLWLASGTTSILELLSTYNNLNANLPAPSAAPAPSLFGPIFNLFLGVASYAPEVGPLFGIADAAFNFGTSLTTDSTGTPAVSLTTTVGQLQAQAAAQFTAQATTTGTQFDFIYQDWGKISTLGTLLAQAQPGSPWYWDTAATGRILQAMAPAVEESYYQSLMSALYAIGAYYPFCYSCRGQVNWGQTPLWEQPQSYTVDDPDFPGIGQQKVQPFNFPPWYPPYTYPTDSTNPAQVPSNPAYTEATATILADNTWLGISAKVAPADGGGNGLYQSPASSILSHLFSSRSAGGLGIYRPAFFESWPFPRVSCDISDDGSGDPGQGCPWGSAASSVEAVPAALNSVAISAGKIKKSGGQLSLTLIVTNNGTEETAGTEISEVSLSALAGSGVTLLSNPGIPIQIGPLLRGASAKIPLTLDIPNTVGKLRLTENGTVTSTGNTTHQFSHSQVIYPSTIR